MVSPTSPSNTQLGSYRQVSSTCSSCPLAQELYICQNRHVRLRPIAYSPVSLKVLESLVLNEIGSSTTRPSDPYQFTYKANRSTLDDVSCLTHVINSHLDKVYKGIKAMFLDFSNAFNTPPRQR